MVQGRSINHNHQLTQLLFHCTTLWFHEKETSLSQCLPHRPPGPLPQGALDPVKAMELPKVPTVNAGQFVHVLDTHAIFKGLGNGPHTSEEIQNAM